jgi:PhzF family phenazine biosynthesis protein
MVKIYKTESVMVIYFYGNLHGKTIVMEPLPIYQIDAFTSELFRGNPACVMPLESWLPDELLLKIAKENAVPETAFFVKEDGAFHIRWFTMEIEMDLCGHATLATAHALKTILQYPGEQISFHSKSGGLEVTVDKDRYTLNFPARMPAPVALPGIIRDALDRQPVEVLKARDYVLVYDKEQDIRDIKVDRQIMDRLNLDPGGVIITAKGDKVDFVSRFFIPQATIFEDPVTGSAHCSLIPYWSERLHKKEMKAMQLSKRVGELFCVYQGERVLISGHARTYSTGLCHIS